MTCASFRTPMAAAILGLVVFLTSGDARAAEWEASGYVKGFLKAIDPAPIETDGGTTAPPMEGLASNRLRLQVSTEMSGSLRFDVAYGISPQVQSPELRASAGGLPRPSPKSYRLRDLRAFLIPDEDDPHGSFALTQNLDRLSVTFSPSLADVTVGRQPMAFGSSRVINPTDVIAPFTYEALDKEERTGVDAVRCRVPLGRFSELDGGVVLGEGIDDEGVVEASAAFLRAMLYVAETDVSPMVLAFRENLLLGLDVARRVGGATAWVEAAYTIEDAFEDGASHDGSLRLSCGMDRQVVEGLYGYIEYHFNGPGSDEPSEYFGLAVKAPYAEGSDYLLGRHYVAPGASYQVTPLLTTGLSALWNVSDGSAFVSPTFNYSFADEVVLEGGAFIGLGSSLRVASGAGLVPTSEFGLYPDLFFTGMRLYF